MPLFTRLVPSAPRGGLFLFATACAVFGSALGHAAEDPLARITPVPDDQPVPVIDFFRPYLFSQASMNRSGSHVGALVPMDELRTGLVFADIDKGTTKVISAIGDHDIYDFDWLTDERTLISVSRANLIASGMYMANVYGRSGIVEQYSLCRLVGVPLKNPEQPLVWIQRNAYDDGKDYGVVQIDTTRSLKGGRNESIADSLRASDDALSTYGVKASVARGFPQVKDGIVTAYFADRMGELAFAKSMTNGIGKLHYFEKRKWLESPVDLDEVVIIAAGDEDGELIVMGPEQDGRPRALQRLDVRTGALGEVIYQDDKYDPEAVSILRDRKTREMIGLRLRGVSTKTVWFSEKHQQVQKMAESALRGQIVALLDSDDKQNRFLVVSYSDKQPPIYHLLDLAKKSLGLVKQSAPWIDPKRAAPMHLIQFKSRDGTPIDAFLTVPTNASEEHPVPLIALPHGGPWASDRWGWDSEAQFLASRGYAVLQPNYRGSTGYDWRFPEDIWNFTKMHEDVTDGVKAVRRMKMIDANRVAIMGTSFGGYLALAGATQEPDLYRCAITQAGVFDWQELVDDAQRFQYEDARYQVLKRHLYEPNANGADLEHISPLRNVAAIKVPVFVAHGSEDRVVSIRQSKQLVNELKSNGYPHEVYFARGEGHGMAELENRVALYSAIEQFLAKNL